MLYRNRNTRLSRTRAQIHTYRIKAPIALTFAINITKRMTAVVDSCRDKSINLSEADQSAKMKRQLCAVRVFS